MLLSNRVRARMTMLMPDAAVRLSGRMQGGLYTASRGRLGNRFGGEPVLVLTTTGRRSGEPRKATVLYGTDGERLVVIGSNTGSERTPAWALNLLAHPDAEVVIRGARSAVRASAATGDERERLWALMAGRYEGFDMYRARTDREIPVFVLERP